jgi:NADH dehydrogenase/NADH:ubiquinone oxidoreductase subunit G
LQNSAKLAAIRRGVAELYISAHPLDCLTCADNDDCELQDTVGGVGLQARTLERASREPRPGRFATSI